MSMTSPREYCTVYELELLEIYRDLVEAVDKFNEACDEIDKNAYGLKGLNNYRNRLSSDGLFTYDEAPYIKHKGIPTKKGLVVLEKLDRDREVNPHSVVSGALVKHWIQQEEGQFD